MQKILTFWLPWFLVLPVQAQLEITPLNDSAFVYTTYMNFEGEPFPSNSMCILTDDGVLMLDTPWDSTQLEPLFDTIQKMWNSRPVCVISTHFHLDRTSGLHWLQGHAVKTMSTEATRELCIANKQSAPLFVVKPGEYHVGNVSIEIYYPGHGHSPDNIVVWVPKWNLLYGGCFVKSYADSDLGNLSHADPKKWIKAALKTRKRYAEAEIVITGHHEWKGIESLDHTIEMLRAYPQK